MATAEALTYQELQAYTLGLGDASFVHQHVVDAWMAQHADSATKPIGLTFALIGLYLHLEKGHSGREVQRVHVLLSQRKHHWPTFELPRERGAVTVVDVMAAPAGPQRREAIDRWSRAVWTAYTPSHAQVEELLVRHGIR